MEELLKKLVQADTTAEMGELAAAELISEHLGRFGIESRIDHWGKNRANLIAEIGSAGAKAGLLFLCHLDVVPPGEGKWKYAPFEAAATDGKIHGRGSVDMKGSIAALVTAIEQVVDSKVKLKGDIIFAATAGEETDSCGVKRFMQNYAGKGPDLAGIIIPEPTDFEIITAHRGMLWLKITTTGKTAHSSTPHLGVNAISSMRMFLDKLENSKTAMPGQCSVSINTISAGKAMNVVPDHCSTGIDIRTSPGQSSAKIIEHIENIFAELKEQNPKFNAQIEIVRDVGALQTDIDCQFVRDFCSAVDINQTKAVTYTTDGPHLAGLGAPIVIFGPGKSHLCHKPDEYIEIADLEKAVEYYKDIIFKFLA